MVTGPPRKGARPAAFVMRTSAVRMSDRERVATAQSDSTPRLSTASTSAPSASCGGQTSERAPDAGTDQANTSMEVQCIPDVGPAWPAPCDHRLRWQLHGRGDRPRRARQGLGATLLIGSLVHQQHQAESSRVRNHPLVFRRPQHQTAESADRHEARRHGQDDHARGGER